DAPPADGAGRVPGTTAIPGWTAVFGSLTQRAGCVQMRARLGLQSHRDPVTWWRNDPTRRGVCLAAEVMHIATVSTSARAVTLADLLEQLGGIDPRRVRANPPPGRATAKDVLRIRQRERRLYELVDGVLVEKVMGLLESSLALDLAILLGYFLDRNDLG